MKLRQQKIEIVEEYIYLGKVARTEKGMNIEPK